MYIVYHVYLVYALLSIMHTHLCSLQSESYTVGKDLSLRTEPVAKEKSQTLEEVRTMYTHTHTHTHTHRHTYLLSNISTHAHTHRHTHNCSHIYTHAYVTASYGDNMLCQACSIECNGLSKYDHL